MLLIQLYNLLISWEVLPVNWYVLHVLAIQIKMKYVNTVSFKKQSNLILFFKMFAPFQWASLKLKTLFVKLLSRLSLRSQDPYKWHKNFVTRLPIGETSTLKTSRFMTLPCDVAMGKRRSCVTVVLCAAVRVLRCKQCWLMFQSNSMAVSPSDRHAC